MKKPFASIGHSRFKPAVFGLAAALIAALLASITLRPGPVQASTHPAPLQANTIHPMSAGNSRLVSQPNSELSRCMAVMPWNLYAGAPVNQWPCDQPFSGPNQDWKHWTFRNHPTYGGAYEIVSDATGFCLDVAYSSQQAGGAVVAYYCTGNANQAWNKVPLGNGTVAYVAVHSGQCLDVNDWGNAYWASMTQWPCHLGPSDVRNQTYTVHGDNAPNGNFMVAGYVDSLYIDGAGIHASGWAITPQAPQYQLGVRTIVDWQNVTGGPYGFNFANTWRPDVNAYWGNGYGNDRGYNYVEPYVPPAGWHYICIQAQSYGYYDTIGCQWQYSPGLSPTLQHGMPTTLRSLGDYNLCVSTGATAGYISSDTCDTYTPEAYAGGYLLRASSDPSQCITDTGWEARLQACTYAANQVMQDNVHPFGPVNDFYLTPLSNSTRCLTAINGVIESSELLFYPCQGQTHQRWLDPTTTTVPACVNPYASSGAPWSSFTCTNVTQASAALDYQRAKTGNKEFKYDLGNNEAAQPDGLDPTNNQVLDTKYTKPGSGSSIYAYPRPTGSFAKVWDSGRGKELRQAQRYKQLLDGTTINKITYITNNATTKLYFESLCTDAGFVNPTQPPTATHPVCAVVLSP